MLSLQTLRERNEPERFQRLSGDDSRTAIPSSKLKALEAELRRKVRGEVRFDVGSRALYSTDGSNYRQVPIGVVIPLDVDDVVATIAAAHRYEAPLLSRGGGTSLAGQCCNVAVVMDFSKYLNVVLDVDAEHKLARVLPGCVLDDLRNTAEQFHLTFGPDPATHSRNTLGGMLGNDSCGIHSLICRNNGMGLRTADNTQELEVLTYDGLRLSVGPTSPGEFDRIVQDGGRRGDLYGKLKAFIAKYGEDIRRGFPQLPRRVSGYNLPQLLPENGCNIARALVGSEGTLVTILTATLNLVPSPPSRSLLVLGYPDVYAAADDVMEILKFNPTGLEGMDHLLFKWEEKRGKASSGLELMPKGEGFLMVEFGGQNKGESDGEARRCMEALKKRKDPPDMKLFDNKDEEKKVWKVREGGLGATAWVPGLPDMWPGWEDSAVPPEQVGSYLRELKNLFKKYGYVASLYGHFGQGCIHCRIPFDLYTADGIKHWRSFMEEATDLVVSCGGSLSGEHGDGQARAEFLPKMFGERLCQAFRDFKSIWDPHWKMNPGKVVDAYKIDENLRLGPDYNPPQPATHFHYASDQHSFARAALRCVGVGDCRIHDGQTMCPSYQVTREEMHSTRGRARLLFEMMNGEVLTDGWRSEAVKEALDLCLACKGCKHDCPVNVDMATYKAEFLSHYYDGRLRPRNAYAMGWIYWWARIAALMPSVANFFSQTPGFAAIAKWFGGIAQERSMPPFAAETFKAWFRRRPVRNSDKPPVLLWPDTFTNHFHPEHGKAAVEVLEHAGYRVVIPEASLCCGRPLYDFGMLDDAKRLLRDILDALRPHVESGVPLVGLEPSCVAVFRDELLNLFPNNEDAKRLHDQSFMLSEFLNKKVKDYQPPKLNRKALVHVHCHHKSIMGQDDEMAILKKLGLEVEEPDKGCCGMAGSFGFEAEHYDVSMRVGERVLLPAVRQTPADRLIIADGFSCQQQIGQGAGRTALHLAQVIQMALHGGRQVSNGRPAEMNGRHSLGTAAAVVGGGMAVGALLAWGLNGRHNGRRLHSAAARPIEVQ